MKCKWLGDYGQSFLNHRNWTWLGDEVQNIPFKIQMLTESKISCVEFVKMNGEKPDIFSHREQILGLFSKSKRYLNRKKREIMAVNFIYITFCTHIRMHKQLTSTYYVDHNASYHATTFVVIPSIRFRSKINVFQYVN